MIVETGKSYDLPSVSYKSRKSGGDVPVQVQKPENQENQCLRAEEDQSPSSAVRHGE